MRGPSISENRNQIAKETSPISVRAQPSVNPENVHSEEEPSGTGPVWKVGRMLVDSLSKGKMRRIKIFGAPLEDLPVNDQGIPKIADRLCCFIERNGIKEPDLFETLKKQPKLVEKYKISFERIGDADLENCASVKTVATLLKIWLHDLPHSLISSAIMEELVASLNRYNRKEIYDINDEMTNILLRCPTINLGVLFILIRLLNLYASECCSGTNVEHLPAIFSPILTGESSSEHTEIIRIMIRYFCEIFDDRIIRKGFKFYVNPAKAVYSEKHFLGGTKEFKRQPVIHIDDKLIRCNSEEGLSSPEYINKSILQNGNKKIDNIRRVSSHEDFSGSTIFCLQTKSLEVSQDKEQRKTRDIKAKHSPNRNINNIDSQYSATGCYLNVNPSEITDIMVAPLPINIVDVNEQEEIRNAERFSQQYGGGCPKKRRKRKYSRTTTGSSYSHDINHNENYSLMLDFDKITDMDLKEDNSSCNPASDSNFQDVECSSSSSSASSLIISPPITPRSPERTLYGRSSSEPLISYGNWNYSHHPPDDSTHNDRSLSPRSSISISRHAFVDSPQKSNSKQVSALELKIIKMSKRVNWLKKQLKYFEQEHHNEFGCYPTQSQKMSNSNYKQMSDLQILLKTNIKQMRKDTNAKLADSKMHHSADDARTLNIASGPMEQVVKEAEKNLHERRAKENRPDCAEDMTFEQLQEEKFAIQSILLDVEHFYGEKEARNEDSFRSIYELYRNVKRLLAKSATLFKLKESSSDLATIKEHETMEFATEDSNNNIPSSSLDIQICMSPGSKCPQFYEISDNQQLNNIHSLSPGELMLEYKHTKQHKRKLKYRIKMYEQEIEDKDSNTNQICIHSLKDQYKVAKAKLRLLHALLVKKVEHCQNISSGAV